MTCYGPAELYIAGARRADTRFRDEDEAIRMANDTEMGLASYVYSADLARALRIGEALDTGMAGINTGAPSDPAAP